MSEINFNLENAVQATNLHKRHFFHETVLRTLHDVSLLLAQHADPNDFLKDLPSVLTRPDGYRMSWMIRYGKENPVDSGIFAGLPGYPDIYESFIREHQLPPCLMAVPGKTSNQVIDPFPAFNPDDTGTILSGYAFPLKVKKHSIGVLVVAFDRSHVNDELHRLLFEQIAHYVMTALTYDLTMKRLRESEEKFRALFERSADAQLIMKGDVFIECNEAMISMLGAKSKEQLIGLTPWELSPEYQPDGMLSRTKGLQLIQDAESGCSIRFEWIHERFDGGEVPVEVSLTPVNYGSESFIHVMMRDIFDRKKAEKDLYVANQLFQLITSNSPDIIWIRNMDLQLTYVNDAVERIKGFTPEEAKARQFKDTITPETYRKYLKYISEELEAEGREGVDPRRIRRYESDEIHRDGSIIHAESQASFIRDEKGNPVGMLGITRDMSEKQKVFLELAQAKEKAEESDRLKSAFLANMSHEIRTPMNSILGFAELLIEENLNSKERKQYIRIIQSGTNQLLSIISDIIDVSKIQASQVKLLPEPVILEKFLSEIEVNFRMELTRHNKSHIQLYGTGTGMGPEQTILIDAPRLGQVMGNLISNAIKFTESGSIEFGCTRNKDHFLFFVRDTGKGISPDHQHIIFDRFRQVEETMNRTYTGTGLGLAICKGLVELMGGKIGVKSELGMGSEFWFTIPVPG